MKHIFMVFMVLTLLCTLISCGGKIDIVPVSIIDSNIYTTEIHGYFEPPHYAVFAIVTCQVHDVDAPNLQLQYKTDYLEIPDTTFSGYPVYNEDTTIKVKMTGHLATSPEVEGMCMSPISLDHPEFVFIGFCAPGTYTFNVNGFEKAFSVGHIK